MKQLVLCFDATGYRFHGDESDSNVLKIFRMLDRDGVCQNSYYQPGFGTYVSSTWLARNPGRIKSWYLKAKDAAVGSTYSQHVQAGYEFLVRYYTPGDSIYIFGFSRGAFIARLVAEMLDHIGLLECGNEELIRFCWETFGTWKRGETSRGMNPKKRERQHKFMQAFRETFCRPVPQIRFLGLFDIVNSVPRIEMMRSRLRYPFTTRTSAKMIRHAVSIDERRTRFRNELISDIHPRAGRGSHKFRRRFWPWHKHASVKGDEKSGESEGGSPGPSWPNMFYRRGHRSRLRDASSGVGSASAFEEEDDDSQDIEEVWFPGGHGDVGGGLPLGENEEWPLSHVPLVWIVQEAQRAGLRFDLDKLNQFNCIDPLTFQAQHDEEHCTTEAGVASGETGKERQFEHALRSASIHGVLHDSLRYGHGVPWPAVLIWRLVEYIPIRRMDFREDGSWKPVRWPLPRGESRSVPPDAKIHASAIHRMRNDPRYRPSNVIDGGRGGRVIGTGEGIGEWEVASHRGSPVRETYRRKPAEHG